MPEQSPSDDATLRQTAVSSPARRTNFTQHTWLLALVLVIATFAAYQPVWHAGFIWDDDSLVTENLALRSLDGLGKIWAKPGTTKQYYPLVFTTFWAEYHLWGLRPFGYHAVNVLLHALNALLLWMVLQQLEIPGAWLAAAVFAVHPVQVESVAWVSELKNLLSTTFYLGALLAFFRFRPLSDKAQAGSLPARFNLLAMALFVCALLSKTVTCSLPAVLVLLIWWKRGRVARPDIEVLSPMFLFGITFGLMTAWLEKHHVGASGPDWSLSLLQRCLLAGRVLWFYAGKMFWPHPLIFIYSRWEIDSGAWWQYLFPAAALAVLLALWSLRSRIGRGPLVAALCFACTLFPALGFFDVFPFRYSYVADHFQYLASVGLITLTAGVGATICKQAGRQGGRIGAVTAAIMLMLLAALAWRQGHIYRDAETLWHDTLTKNPECWIARNNLGSALLQAGKVPEAIEQYEQGVRIRPDYAVAHNNLGIALMGQGRLQEAIGHYEQALRLNPDYAEAHYNLGIALEKAGRVPEAIQHYEQTLRIKPDYAEAHNNLGMALAQTGHLQEAIGHYEQALQIKPDAAVAHYNLGNGLARLGRVQEAIGHYEQALQTEPDYAEAHNNLGNALLRAGKVQEAIGHYERALRLQPNNTEAHYNLRNTLVQLGKVQEAIGHYEQSLQINPQNAEAHYNLGVALEQAGRVQEAIGHYKQALRIKPDFAQAQNALARLQAGQ